MNVLLKYGEQGLSLELPETPGFAGMLKPREAPALPDPAACISQSLCAPIAARSLADIAREKKNACIVVSDRTRPVPNHLLQPPILETLASAGIPASAVCIIIATGMHRSATDDEILQLVGADIAGTCRVINHDGHNRDDMAELGTLAGGIPVLVNRSYMEAELKILTGFIEPHMWAGYSGGRKSILPGIAAIETLRHMHGPDMVAHPGCEYGELAGNPFHEAGLAVMAMAGADFIANVTLNTKKEVTGVFCGHPVAAHLEGCGFLSRHCLLELEAPLDFIITTNSGAPLDCNLYQTVKGITGAAAVVKKGGDIVIASRCTEGAGNPEYKKLLEAVDSPKAFLSRLMRHEFFCPDQWCAQEMYQVALEHPVWLYSEGLSPDEIRRYHLRPVRDMAEAVREQLHKHGPRARWAIVPDGPMVILKYAAPGPRNSL